MADHLISVSFLCASLIGVIFFSVHSPAHRTAITDETRKVASLLCAIIAVYKLIHINIMLVFHFNSIPKSELTISLYMTMIFFIFGILLFINARLDEVLQGIKPYIKNGLSIAKYTTAAMGLQTLFIYIMIRN